MIQNMLHMPLFWAMLTIASFTVGQHLYRLIEMETVAPSV